MQHDQPRLVIAPGHLSTSVDPQDRTRLVIAPGHPSTPVDPAILETRADTAPLPMRPGLLTTKSRCCQATVVAVGRGLVREVCSVCGRDHHESRLR